MRRATNMQSFIFVHKFQNKIKTKPLAHEPRTAKRKRVELWDFEQTLFSVRTNTSSSRTFTTNDVRTDSTDSTLLITRATTVRAAFQLPILFHLVFQARFPRSRGACGALRCLHRLHSVRSRMQPRGVAAHLEYLDIHSLLTLFVAHLLLIY